MVNGFIDRLFYGRGLVNRDLPFAELKARATINEKALAADTDPDFSRRIREGLPPRRRWVSSRRPQDAPGRPALRQETGSDPKDCSIEQIRGGWQEDRRRLMSTTVLLDIPVGKQPRLLALTANPALQFTYPSRAQTVSRRVSAPRPRHSRRWWWCCGTENSGSSICGGAPDRRAFFRRALPATAG